MYANQGVDSPHELGNFDPKAETLFQDNNYASAGSKNCSQITVLIYECCIATFDR